MSARYEVREMEPGEYGRALGVERYFDVWDNTLNKRVPFGRYRKRGLAENRLAALRALAETPDPAPPAT